MKDAEFSLYHVMVIPIAVADKVDISCSCYINILCFITNSYLVGSNILEQRENPVEQIFDTIL